MLSSSYPSDVGQVLDEEAEDLRRQGLLQDLQQLLRLTTHGHSVAQVLHAQLDVAHGQ